MISDNWVALKLLFGLAAAAFGLVAALFHWRAAAPKERHQKARERYARWWTAIDANPWLIMPERVIGWLISAKTRLVAQAERLTSSVPLLLAMWGSSPFALGLAAFFLWSKAVGTTVLIVAIVPWAFVSTVFLPDRWLERKDSRPTFILWIAVIGFFMAVIELGLLLPLYAVGATILWAILIQRVAVLVAPLLTLLLVPVFWFGVSAITSSAAQIWRHLREWALTDRTGIRSKGTLRHMWYKLTWSPGGGVLFMPFVAMSYSASLFVTVAAFAVGRIADPHHWVPQTPQMIASNLIFDTLTVLTTAAILGWAVRKKGLFRIPLAVVFDILVAAILACLSLYCGLLGTSHAVSPREVLNVLLAHSIGGEYWDLGPYFWVMHTTFLPTLAYLFLTFVCWLGKLMLVFVRFLFGEAKAAQNPLLYTARLFLVVAALCTLLAAGAAMMESRAAKEKELSVQPHTQLLHAW